MSANTNLYVPDVWLEDDVVTLRDDRFVYATCVTLPKIPFPSADGSDVSDDGAVFDSATTI